ncbi:MAG: lamin tail domain-containing protein [Paludibacter sp.]|nr:lamin tail domain-containing protein [Paludibacter sp.]
MSKLTTDDAFTNAFTSQNTSTKVWSSSNTAVATVAANGEVTIVGAGSTNIQVTQVADATYCAVSASYALTVSAPSYTITPSSNNESFGTVSLSGTVITGAPLAGYTYASPAYTVLSGTATVSQNGNAFTVTPTSNCAVRINFEALPTYTVTFDKGTGDCATASLTESIGGAGVTLPTATPPASCVAQNWEFAGWAAASQSESTTSPTLYAAGATYNPVSNITLYAVYKVMGSGGMTPTSNTITIGGSTTGWTINDRGWNASYWGLANGNTYSILSPTIDLSTITSVNVTVRTYGTTSGSSNVLEVLNADGTISYGTYVATSSFVDKEFTQTSSPFTGNGQLRFKSQGTVDGAGLRVTDITINYSVISSITTYNSNPSCSDPIITVSETTLSGFTYAQGSGPSSEQSFTVSGVNLTNNISIAASANYEISKTSGSGYASPLTFTSGEAATPQTVYVRLKSGLAEGNFNDEVINITSTGADAKTVTVSGSVTAAINPEPTAHVTGFGAVEDGQNAIILDWTDAAGADGYLIKASTTSFEAIAAPVDGTPESDGTLVKNVAKELEIVEFTGLAAGTTYYFKIWPYSNSGASIDYKTDGSVPQTSAMTEAIVTPNVIITEVFGGGGNSGATLKNDFIELYNTTESPVDISGWSVQYYSATGTSATVTEIPSGSIIPAKSHFLIQQAAGSGGTVDLFEPNVIGTIAMAGAGGKVILFTTNSAQTITSSISSVTGNENFKDYLPYGASTPVWGSAMSATTNTTSATRKIVEGEYVYTQNIGNDFEVVSPTPQNTGKFQSKASGSWGSTATWEFTDNGTWGDATIIPTSSTGKVNISSGTEVTIAANSTASSTTILDGGKLTLNNGFTFEPGTFTIEDGGTFVDKRSDATKTAINATVNVELTGSATAAARQWWYVSSPVAAATAAVFNPEGDNNIGYFDETLSTPNYVQILSNSDPLHVGKGYLFQNKATATYTFTGALNTGDVTLNLTRTGNSAGQRGFHIVGNPYPSYLNWKNAFDAGTTSNVRNTIWYRTTTGSANGMKFLTFNAATQVGTEGVSGVVPPMQGFWMKVHADNSNGVIKFTNDMRSHATSPGNSRKAPAVDNKQLLRLQVSNSLVTDEMVLVGIEGASDAFEKYDSEKMANNSPDIPELYTLIGSQEIAINSVEALTIGKQFILGFRPGQAGSFSIKATELTNLENVKVILKDNQLNTETELLANESYTFTSDATATANRFSIEFRAPGATTSLHEVNAKNTLVYVNEANQIEVQSVALSTADRISVFNLAGQQLVSQAASGQVTVINEPFSAGVYLVKVNSHLQKVIVK